MATVLGWLRAVTAQASVSNRRRRFGIGGEVGGEKFEGDLAVQTVVAGLENFIHAARAEEGGDFVGSHPGAGRERHSQ